MFPFFPLDPLGSFLAILAIVIGVIIAVRRPSNQKRRMKKEGREKKKIGDKEYWV